MIYLRAQRLAALMLLAGAVPASPAWAYEAYWDGGSGTFSFARYDEDDNLIASHWRTGPDSDDKGPVPGPYELAVFDHSLPNFPTQQVRFDRNVDNGALKIHNGTVEFRIRNSDTQENHIYNLAGPDGTYQSPLLELANEDNESAIMKVTAGKLISSIGYDNDQGYSMLAYTGSGTSATAIVTGQNATWIGGKVLVGREGTGAVRVENGGTLSISSLSVGRGAVRVKEGGTASTGFATIGNHRGHEGKAFLVGEDASWSSGGIKVGSRGHGTLNIREGATMTSSGDVYISDGDRYAETITTKGDVSVTGEGSTWSIASGGSSGSRFYIGELGEGTLTISDGGRVSSAEEGQKGFDDRNRTFIGAGDNQTDFTGTGHVTVTGDGSTWENEKLYVGDEGSGDVTVSDGGRLFAKYHTTIGQEAGSSGTVTVTGADSSIESSFQVGYDGLGKLVIKNGATVDSSDSGASIGHSDEVTDSQVTVTGTGSRWDIGRGLDITHGTLRIEDGAVVNTAMGHLGNYYDGDSIGGKLIVSGAGSALHNQKPQYLTYFRVGHAGISSYLRVENGGEVTAAQTMIVNASTVDLADGTVETDGDLLVREDGTIQGVGTLNVGGGLYNQGTIVPGFSPGTITIGGDWAQSGTGSLVMEIAGLSDGRFDVLDITGDATLGGTLKLKFIDGFAPEDGDVFDLLTAGGTLDGGFDTIDVAGLEPGWQYQTASEQGTFRVTSLNDGAAVPEPATWMLLGLGVFGSLTGRRLRRCA